MISDGTLDATRENAECEAAQVLEVLAQAELSTENEILGLDALTYDYRVMGISFMLQNFDPSEFTRYLKKAGSARLRLLERHPSTQGGAARYLVTSRTRGFEAALACGDLDTAASIAERSPRECDSRFEYEDDFLFAHFLHRMVIEPAAADLEAIVGRWTEVLEGKSSGQLEVCKALLEGSSPVFEAALESLIDSHLRSFKEYREELDFDPTLYVAERNLFVNGLAVLQIAGLRGIATKREYSLLPGIARVAATRSSPDSSSWRSLD